MLAIINDTVAHLLLPGSDIVKYLGKWCPGAHKQFIGFLEEEEELRYE